MMRAFFTTLQLLLIASFVSSQTAGVSDASRTPTNVEQQLMKVVREMFDAFGRGDKQALDRIFADNFLDTTPDGHTATKAQLLENVRPLPTGVHLTFDLEDVQVRDYDRVAVMIYRMVIGEEIYGRTIKFRFRVTDTFIYRDGRWQIIARQESRIPAELVAATVNPKVYDAYVGQYRLTPALTLTVMREGDRLMVQRTGQPTATELLPKNESVFFMRGQSGERVFVKDERGQVTHMIVRLADGQEIKAEKIK